MLRYANYVMATTIDDVARTLGVSVRGVRLRVAALSPAIDAHLRRGENNRQLYTGEALAMLRRLEELRQAESNTVRQAGSRVLEELNGNGDKSRRQSPSEMTSIDPLVAELLRSKDDQIEHLREEVKRLNARIDQLLPLALPVPRRWWPFSRRQRS